MPYISKHDHYICMDHKTNNTEKTTAREHKSYGPDFKTANTNNR